MRLNKFATWGVLPPPAGQPKPGPESLRARLKDIAVPLASNANLGPRLDALSAAVEASGVTASIDRMAAVVAPLGQLPAGFVALIDRLDESSAQSAADLQAIKVAIEKLAEDGKLPDIDVPSRVAWEIVGCLGQVREALFDRKLNTAEKVNGQLEIAEHSTCAKKAFKVLADANEDELLSGLRRQYRPLAVGPDLEAQRRVRLAELTRFEWLLLATLYDAPEA